MDGTAEKGTIHGELDIKIFILYILRKLPLHVDPDILLELCTFDTGVGYFDYAQYLCELLESEHILTDEDGFYYVSEKGIRNGKEGESSLPLSFRRKTDELIAPIISRMNRRAMISCSHEVSEDGSCMLSLSLADGMGEIFSLRMLMADEEGAKAAEKLFRLKAEGIYSKIAGLLTEKQERKNSRTS